MRLRERIVLRLAGALPASLVRAIGRLQFRIPVLRRLVASSSQRLSGVPITITGGQAAGLTIVALDTNIGYRLGTTEPELQDFLAAELSAGDVFYDVGANVGFFTLVASRAVGPTGRVVAFEPMARAAELLRRNAENNALHHIEVVQAAVAGHVGEANFTDGESSLSGRLTDESSGVSTPVITLDHACSDLGLPVPSIVKLDIEGAEVDAVAGMSHVLATASPTLLIEVHWCRDAVVHELRKHDYIAAPFGDVDLTVGPSKVHGMLLARRGR